MSKKGKKVALVGIPNSGKTSLFNALTGLNQRVGNFSGVTVDRKSAALSLKGKTTVTLIDLPGTHTLYPSSEDEKITSEIIRDTTHQDHPDLVLCVVSALQLKRGLVLASQIIDLGMPLILVVNMTDLLDKGSVLDLSRLSYLLDVPAIGISVKQGSGISTLKKTMGQDIPASSKPQLVIPSGFRLALNQVQESLQTENAYQAFQSLLSPEDKQKKEIHDLDKIQQSAGITPEEAEELISNELTVRLEHAGNLFDQVYLPEKTDKINASTFLDRVLLHPFWGYLIFLLILLTIFQSIFSWSSYPMDQIDLLMEGIKGLVSAALPAGFFTDLLTEGVITGIAGIVVFIPQIAFLFFFISLMEESGYMARVVFLMDKIMKPFGFSGKSIIPLMGGMACAIPSIMMTRNIPNKSERIITIMVTPLMSCSARIPVYILLIAMLLPADSIFGIDQRGLFMTGLYLLGFVLSLAIAWIIKKLINQPSQFPFLMELPDYQMPRWRNVGLTVYQKTRSFVVEAGKVIMVISIVLWALVTFGPSKEREAIETAYQEQLAQPELSEEEKTTIEINYSSAQLESSYAAKVGKFIEPAIKPLGYDWKIGISLICSFAAREVFVGTMSIIYAQENPEESEDELASRDSLIQKMRQATDPETGKPVYTTAVLLSLLVFFAIAMQCMSTLAVTWSEAGWQWALIMLAYLSALAYLSSWSVFQLFS
ncbi:MAG: ferrous iron transport protein B [Bacteroidota bacterium]